MAEWLTLEESATYCRLSYWHFRRLVARGIIYHPPRQKKSKYRFRKIWLDDFLMGKRLIKNPVAKKYKHLEVN
jgi:hypothetical protein